MNRFKYFSIRWVVAGLGLALMLCSFGFYIGASIGSVTVIESILTLMPQKRLTGVNILAVGVDDTKTSQRSDTILVLHLDDVNQRIGIISIPRDTYIKIEGQGMTKVNHAYSHGGIKLLQKSVSNFLNIPIDYYIKIYLKGVENIVDQLGGISIDVEKNMFYKDQAGDVYIDLEKGHQNLNGKEMVSYLRFRHDQKGDIGRIKRHQSFIRSVIDKVMDSGEIWKAPRTLMKLADNLDTNLSKREIIGLALQFSEVFKSNNFDVGTIPGAVTLIDGVSYWRPDIIRLDSVVDTMLHGFETKVAQVEIKVETVDKRASQEERRTVTLKEVTRLTEQTNIIEREKADVKSGKLIYIEILNGNGIDGEARWASAFLKERGYKIPWIGNAGSFNYEETLLVDWKGNTDRTIALAAALRIDPSKIIVYDRPEKKLDVSIVLGKDWESIRIAWESSQTL
ncbi:MAG: LCP family protein [Candidatus Margulisbacteria bacterium]|nr:LCP family protein [Candidatus Margulisiibacteriota bacterium]